MSLFIIFYKTAVKCDTFLACLAPFRESLYISRAFYRIIREVQEEQFLGE